MSYDRSDVVVVEGLSPGPAKLYASGLNQALAKAIDADVVLVASWPRAGAGIGQDQEDRTAETELGLAAGTIEGLAEALAITASGYWSGEHARVVGCVVNGVPAKDPPAAAELGEALVQHGLRTIAMVPHRPELTWLRVRDMVREMGLRVLSEGDLSRRIKEVAVFAQRSARVVSIGPMLQGLAKPVNDLSRGALVDDIVYTLALTAVQSHAG